MATFLTALAKLTGIGLLVNTVISFAIKLIMAIVSTIYFLAATIILQAMCELDISVIDGWFDNAVGSNFTNTITGVGLFICLILTLWEMLKYIWTFVTGENPQSRPGAIAVKLLTYGAWTTVAIPTSKVLFTAFHEIYKAVKTMLFGGESVLVALGNFYSSGNSLTADSFTSSISDIEGENEGLSLFLKALDVIDAIPVILGTVLLVICMFQFLKLLLSAFSKFSSIIIYIYLSPLATGCGVSQSLRGITWSWFKNFVSTLICWILNLWMIYSTLCLFKAFPSGGGVQFFCWTGVTLGWVRCGQNLDSILKDVGLTVTHSSGSVMQDMREMGYMWRTAKGFAGKAADFATGATNALARGAGLKALDAIVPGTSKVAQTLGASLNNGAARSNGQIAKDFVIGGLAAMGVGQNSTRISDGINTAKKFFGIPSAKDLTAASKGATGFGGKLNAVNDVYKNAKNSSGKLQEKADYKSDNAGSELMDRLSQYQSYSPDKVAEMVRPQGMSYKGQNIERNKDGTYTNNGETEEAYNTRLKDAFTKLGAPDETFDAFKNRIEDVQTGYGTKRKDELGQSVLSGSAQGARDYAVRNGYNPENSNSPGMKLSTQEKMFGEDSNERVKQIKMSENGKLSVMAEDNYGNLMEYTPVGNVEKKFTGSDSKSGDSGIVVGTPEQMQLRAVGGTTVEPGAFDGTGATATHVDKNTGAVTRYHAEEIGKDDSGHIQYSVERLDENNNVVPHSKQTVLGTLKSTDAGIAAEVAGDVSPAEATNRARHAVLDESGRKTGEYAFDSTYQTGGGSARGGGIGRHH